MLSGQTNYSILYLLVLALLFSAFKSAVIDTINSITIPPTITTISSIDTSILPSISKFQAYGNYVYRLSINNSIDVWDMQDSSFPNKKFSTNSANTIIDFAIQQTTGTFSYVDNLGNVYIIRITDGSVQATFNVGFSTVLSQIQMSWYSIFVTLPGNSSVTPKLYRFRRSDQTLIQINDMHQLANEIKISKCIKPIGGWANQFILGWDSTSYIMMYSFSGDWPNTYGDRNFRKNIAWALTDIQWGDWCDFYTATYQVLNQSTVYYHVDGHLVKTYVFTEHIYSSILFDARKLILAVFLESNTAEFVDRSQSGTSVFLSQNYVNLSYYNKFSQNTSTFFVATDSQINVYLMECSTSYSLAMGICSLCDENGNCYQTPTNSSNNSSSQNKTSEIGTTGSYISEMGFMKEYLIKTMTVISYTILVMQGTPFINYFLRFVNFWAICSMYTMLNISLEEYFYQIMLKFYQITNISLFQFLNIKAPSIQLGQEKVTGKNYDIFQTSTILSSTILQPFILISSSIMSIFLFNRLAKTFLKHSTYKKIKLDVYIGVQSSFVSQINNFMFPLSFIFANFYQRGVIQKVNLTLNTLLIFMCVMCPLAVLLLHGQKIKKKSAISLAQIPQWLVKKTKYNSVISHRFFDLFFVSTINIMLPALITIGNPLWFIFVGGALHLIRIWIDYLRSQFTINGVLLSVQLLVFHSFYSALYFKFSLQTKQFLILCILVTLILGGIHQIFTILFGVIYQIYQFSKQNKIEPQNSQNSCEKPQSINIQDKNQGDESKQLKKKPRIKFFTTLKEIQNNQDIIHFQPRRKKITIKTTYKTKKDINFLTILPSSPLQVSFRQNDSNNEPIEDLGCQIKTFEFKQPIFPRTKNLFKSQIIKKRGT